MSFQCSVITPEQSAFDGPVSQAIIPAHDGLMGLLDGRAPLLVKLNIGPLRLDPEQGKSRFFFIDGGVAQMKANTLTIVTRQATPAEELDFESAKAEYAEATARKASSPAEIETRNNELSRARAKQALAGKK